MQAIRESKNRMKNFTGCFFYLLAICSLLFHGGIDEYFILSIFTITSLALLFAGKHAPQLNILYLPLLVILCVQFIPLPHSLHNLVSPYLAGARDRLGIQGGFFPLAADPRESITGWMRLLTIAGVILLSTAYFKGADAKKFFHIFLIIVFAEATYALIMLIRGSDSFLLFGQRIYTDVATGSFINKNHFGLFIAAAIPFGIYFCTEAMGKSGKKAGIERKVCDFTSYTTIISILFMALILSRSRGALISLGAGIVVLFFMLERRFRRKLFISAVLPLGISAAILVWFKAPGVFSRFYELGLGVAESRAPLWTGSAKLIREYPLTGIGPGSFEKVYQKYNHSNPFTSIEHPHNEYLAFIIDLGIPAGLLVIILLLALIYVGYRNSITGNNLDKIIFSVLIIFLVNFTADYNLSIPANALFFAIVTGYILSKSKIRLAPFGRMKMPLSAAVILLLSIFIFARAEEDKTKISMGDYFLSPFDTDWMLLNARQHWNREQYNDAKHLFDCAYMTAPYNDNVYFNRALFYISMKRETKNRRIPDYLAKNSTANIDDKTHEKLLKELPDITSDELTALTSHVNISTAFHYITASLELGRADLAGAIVKNKQDNIFKSDCVLYNVGELLDRSGAYHVMLDIFKEAKKTTDFPLTDFFLARSHARLKDYDIAEQICREAIEKYPSPRIYLELASIYSSNGNKERVIPTLLEARKKYPGDDEIIRNLADAYNNNGMFNRALDTYAEYLEKTGDKSVLDTVRKLLKTEEVKKRMAIPDIILQYNIHD